MIVKKIILINIIVYLICEIFSIYGYHLDNLFALYPITSDYFSPFQLITHLFIHGNIEHLFFNMLFFFLTGPEVEELFGKKFLSFYLLSGVFSSGLYCLGANSGLIGASGAVFSVIAVSLITTFKNENFKKFISLKLKFIFYVFLIITELYYSLNPQTDLIGHWAHIFGVVFGIIYYLKFKFAHPEGQFDK